MTTTLKHVAALLVGLFLVEMLIIGNIVASNIAVASDTADKPPILAVTDVAYDASAETEVETEATPEPAPEAEIIDPTPAETYWEGTDYSSDWTSTEAATGYAATDSGVSAAEFQQLGVLHDGQYSYTYYSERVLPGGGLAIPGRHTDSEGYVCDADGNVCVASDDLPKGTVVTLPVSGDDGTSRTGVVYDCGSGYGNLDIYTSW